MNKTLFNFSKKIFFQVILRKLRWVILAIIFLYLVLYIERNWQQIKNVEYSFDPFYLIAGTICFTIDYSVQLFVFRILLKTFGFRSSLIQSWGLYCIPQLGKYLPGKIAPVAGLMYLLKRHGYRPEKGLTLAVLYMAIDVTGALLIGLALLPLSPTIWRIPSVPFLFGLLPMLVVFLFTDFFYRIVNFGLRLLSRPPMDQSLSNNTRFKVMILAGVHWFLLGLTFWTFARMMFPVPLHTVPLLITALSISYVSGLLAFFVPAGLGVREAVMFITLEKFFSPSQAMILTTACRLWMTLGELLFTLLGGSLYFKTARYNDNLKASSK